MRRRRRRGGRQRYAAARNLTLICRPDRYGAWICDGRHAAARARLSVDVVDTIGAGDAHCAGLLAGCPPAGRCRRRSILANRVAACVVASLGAANPPDRQQLQQRFLQA
ncbi:PfkB family carbohydrate kinase [Serratia ureilytica]